jgi:hypothetical protein
MSATTSWILNADLFRTLMIGSHHSLDVTLSHRQGLPDRFPQNEASPNLEHYHRQIMHSIADRARTPRLIPLKDDTRTSLAIENYEPHAHSPPSPRGPQTKTLRRDPLSVASQVSPLV